MDWRINQTAANIALPQSGRTEVRSTSLSYCSSVFRWTDLQLAFVVRRKIRSFNKQHHPADTASNAQPAAMPPLAVTQNDIMRNLMVLFILFFYSCNQSRNNENDALFNSLDTGSSYQFSKQINKIDTSNQEIYGFMKMIIEDKKLHLDYGLSIDPQPRCNLTDDDVPLLNSLLIEKPKKRKVDTKDWRTSTITVDAHELTKCLTKKDIISMLAQRQKLFQFKWDNSRLGFNLLNNKNWYCFSIPIFSKDKTKAIMMILDLCEGLCGTGEILVYTKKKNSWSSESLEQWVH